MSSPATKTALITGGNKGIGFAICKAAAPRTPEQGADTAIWLATEGRMQQSGKFFRNRNEQPY